MRFLASSLLFGGCLACLYEAGRRVVFGSAWDLTGSPVGLWLRRRGNPKDDSRFIDRTPIVRKPKEKKPKAGSGQK